MAHISTHSGVFSLPKAHLSARSRMTAFYVAVAIVAMALALPAAILTAAAPPL